MKIEFNKKYISSLLDRKTIIIRLLFRNIIEDGGIIKILI